LFSAREHKGQVRASGEPYLVHPLEVANILADMRLDAVSVSTGLHDVVEDTLVDLDTIKQYFGEEVTHLVDGLTKIAQISNVSHEEQQAENVRKMLLAMVNDVRGARQTRGSSSQHAHASISEAGKRQRIAQETMDIYAPIAHRLGMGKLRSELEDLAFRHLYPEDYRSLTAQLEKRRPPTKLFSKTPPHASKSKCRKLKCRMCSSKVASNVSTRSGKLRAKKSNSIRFTISSPRALSRRMKCATATRLGVMHSKWRPVPGRIKDWIATPRDNLYQSLHTSVIGDKGQPFEVQIRTEEMHHIAEEGVAAHWKYKEGSRGAHDDDKALQGLRSLIECRKSKTRRTFSIP
jgi:GTP pyrophosphokinase